MPGLFLGRESSSSVPTEDTVTLAVLQPRTEMHNGALNNLL